MNFFRGFWHFLAGDEDTQRLAAKRNKAAQNEAQSEAARAEPNDEQWRDDNYFEADEFYDHQ